MRFFALLIITIIVIIIIIISIIIIIIVIITVFIIDGTMVITGLTSPPKSATGAVTKCDRYYKV